MKASAPKTNLWIIALILGILGIVANYVAIPYVSEYNYYLLLAGFVLLALGTSLKGV
jgi:hypothetical protein